MQLTLLLCATAVGAAAAGGLRQEQQPARAHLPQLKFDAPKVKVDFYGEAL
jgi:hypothetical protein